MTSPAEMIFLNRFNNTHLAKCIHVTYIMILKLYAACTDVLGYLCPKQPGLRSCINPGVLAHLVQ